MKKHLATLSFFFLAGIALVSCRKDLGNYDYTDANAIRITTDMASVDRQVVITDDSVVVKQNDSLKIDILVTQTTQSNDLSYQWMITQATSSVANPPQYIVGTSKQLRTRITLLPSLYRLVVKVTDNTTGVSFYKFYNLNVNTAPWGGEGWLVLQDQSAQGGSDISIITSRDGVASGAVYHNLYMEANKQKLPMGTNRMAVLNYSNTLYIQKVSFFYPNGGIQVRSIDYSDSADHNSWFTIPPSQIDVQANAVAPMSGQYEYMINNGQLYSQQVNVQTIKAPIKLGAPILGSWPELSPYVLNNAASDNYLTLFDKGNRCFFLFRLDNNSFVPTTQPDAPNKHFVNYAGTAADLSPTTGKGFDLNNIRHNLVYAENAQRSVGVGTMFNCFFRNNAGDSTFLYQFGAALAYANNIATGRYFLKETVVPGINKATIFAVPTHLTLPGGVFYYVHGTNTNSIYVCNPTYLPATALPATTTSHLGYSFAAGTVIKAMKVFKSGYITVGIPSTEGKVLVVATDETANGNGHKVYFFNLTATGEISSTPAQVYTGFDKIVDITFKKGLGL